MKNNEIITVGRLRPRGILLKGAYRLRRYLASTLFLIVFGAGAWLERVTLLRGAADLWIMSDPITPADAVVILGGGIEVRPFVAADLYAKGLVHKVLLSKAGEGYAVSIGGDSGSTEANLKVLRKLGVPDAAIELFGHDNRNTEEEAVALKDWVKHHGASILIIPTEIFFARRVRWMFEREFSGTGVRIEVPSFDPPSGYSRVDWWTTEEGRVAFQNEVLKYFYYRLKY